MKREREAKAEAARAAARREDRQVRRAIRALEKVARGYCIVADGCKAFDALSLEECGGPSAWARPEGKKALKRAAEAATMAGILRGGLGE